MIDSKYLLFYWCIFLCFQIYIIQSLQKIPLISTSLQHSPIRSQFPLPTTSSFNKILINMYSWHHSIIISVGTPKQNFRVLFDTGSGTLDIPQINCQGCMLGNKFNPNQSSSLRYLDKKININFVDKTQFIGYKAVDIVQLQNLQVQLQLAVIQKWKYIHDQNKNININFDGLMGLQNGKKKQNIFDIGSKNKKLVSSTFAFQFGLKQYMQDSNFYYNISQSDFTEAFYVPTITKNTWSVKVQSFYMDGLYLDIKIAIVDSGSSWIAFPKKIYKEIYQKIFAYRCRQQKQLGSEICQCQNPDQYPTIYINLQNYTIIITPYMYLMYIDNYYTQCLLIFQSFEDLDQIMLGLTFMQHYTVIFNKQQSKVGFIPRLKRLDFYTKDKEILNIFEFFTCILVSINVLILIGECMNRKRNTGLRVDMNQPNIQLQMENNRQNSKENKPIQDKGRQN